mmetsp:Transcript_7052/g.12787  ORF Transcript_7052/g.12787 Transcript_7052/m.12787 type:complete len:131 (+) Transcript_7052:91-483(+)
MMACVACQCWGSQVASTDEQTIQIQNALLQPEQERRYFDISIDRDSLEDRLGLDVVHYPGFLEVRNIFPDCVIERYNRMCDLRTDAAEQLMPNDYIHSINGVKDEKQMVEKCRTDKCLKLTVSRARLLVY